MICFLISPEPLSISMDTLVRDFQYPDEDMIDIDYMQAESDFQYRESRLFRYLCLLKKSGIPGVTA